MSETDDPPPPADRPPATPAEPSSAAPEASAAPAEPSAASPEPSIIVAPSVARTTPPAADEPILPPVFDEDQLRDAVGAPPKKRKRPAERPLPDDDGDDSAPRSRRTIVIAALAIVVGLAIAALVFLGRANAQRYLVACSADHVSAERGRAFPPWGSQPLPGPEWTPIALPASAECKPRETEELAELEAWYLELLVERASATLTAPNVLDALATPPGGKPGANPLDLAAEQLHQALLLSRAPERRDQRKDVERLLGDVQYWRASLRLRDASAALVDASREFDAAAAQRPRHVTDAAAWAAFLRKLADDLRAGPSGVAAPVRPAPTSEHPSAPQGSALPVEPPPEPTGSDAAPTPPDAGVPTGGVLL